MPSLRPAWVALFGNLGAVLVNVASWAAFGGLWHIGLIILNIAAGVGFGLKLHKDILKHREEVRESNFKLWLELPLPD